MSSNKDTSNTTRLKQIRGNVLGNFQVYNPYSRLSGPNGNVPASIQTEIKIFRGLLVDTNPSVDEPVISLTPSEILIVAARSAFLSARQEADAAVNNLISADSTAIDFQNDFFGSVFTIPSATASTRANAIAAAVILANNTVIETSTKAAAAATAAASLEEPLDAAGQAKITNAIQKTTASRVAAGIMLNKTQLAVAQVVSGSGTAMQSINDAIVAIQEALTLAEQAGFSVAALASLL